MAELVLAGAIVAGIAAPHVLPFDRVAPARMAAVWFLALLLRALTAAGVALLLVADLHGPHPILTIDDWHPQHALSLASATLDVAVHPTAHLVALVPLLLLGAPLAWLAISLARDVLVLRRLLASRVHGGPPEITIVRDDRVLVAVAGLGRGRVLMSDGALLALDADEFEASVAHEIGHLRRRHRPLLVIARLFAALAWMLPGTRRARRQLIASLECDADDYAVRSTGNPLALASAICKAAATAPATVMALRGPAPVTLRLQRLLGDNPPAPAGIGYSTRSLVVLLAIATALLTEATISIALLGPDIAHLLDPAQLDGSH